MKVQNKKIKIINFILISLFLFPAFFVFAQIEIDDRSVPPAIECCKLKHSIKVAGKGFGAGTVVGSPSADNNSCPLSSSITKTPHWAGICTLDGIYSAGEMVMYIALVLTSIALVLAGILFITATGNPDRVKLAKEVFKYSFIGVMIATLSRFIPAVARYFIGI